MHAFWLVLTYDLLEDRRIDDVIFKTIFGLFDSSLYKTNRFQVAVRLFNNRSQRTSRSRWQVFLSRPLFLLSRRSQWRWIFGNALFFELFTRIFVVPTIWANHFGDVKGKSCYWWFSGFIIILFLLFSFHLIRIY